MVLLGSSTLCFRDWDLNRYWHYFIFHLSGCVPQPQGRNQNSEIFNTDIFSRDNNTPNFNFLSSTVKDLSENGLGNFLIAKEQCLRGWDYSKTLCELCKAIQSDIYSLLHVQNPYRVSFKTTLMSLKIQKSTTTVQIHATVLVWDINMCYYWIPFHC